MDSATIILCPSDYKLSAQSRRYVQLRDWDEQQITLFRDYVSPMEVLSQNEGAEII